MRDCRLSRSGGLIPYIVVAAMGHNKRPVSAKNTLLDSQSSRSDGKIWPGSGYYIWGAGVQGGVAVERVIAWEFLFFLGGLGLKGAAFGGCRTAILGKFESERAAVLVCFRSGIVLDGARTLIQLQLGSKLPSLRISDGCLGTGFVHPYLVTPRTTIAPSRITSRIKE